MQVAPIMWLFIILIRDCFTKIELKTQIYRIFIHQYFPLITVMTHTDHWYLPYVIWFGLDLKP